MTKIYEVKEYNAFQYKEADSAGLDPNETEDHYLEKLYEVFGKDALLKVEMYPAAPLSDEDNSRLLLITQMTTRQGLNMDPKSYALQDGDWMTDLMKSSRTFTTVTEDHMQGIIAESRLKLQETLATLKSI